MTCYVGHICDIYFIFKKLALITTAKNGHSRAFHMPSNFYLKIINKHLIWESIYEYMSHCLSSARIGSVVFFWSSYVRLFYSLVFQLVSVGISWFLWVTGTGFTGMCSFRRTDLFWTAGQNSCGGSEGGPSSLNELHHCIQSLLILQHLSSSQQRPWWHFVQQLLYWRSKNSKNI